jgi:DNA repair exonuclease SbcCD ATPase subunit
MNAAKAYRKLKEVEETKLSNRLSLLRQELARSQRKIEETERRTQGVLAHQAELEQKQKEKVEQLRKRMEEQQMAQQINQIARTRMAIIRRVSHGHMGHSALHNGCLSFAC